MFVLLTIQQKPVAEHRRIKILLGNPGGSDSDKPSASDGDLRTIIFGQRKFAYKTGWWFQTFLTLPGEMIQFD